MITNGLPNVAYLQNSSLINLKKDDENNLVKYITTIVSKFAVSLNLVRPLTITQSYEIALTILEKYYYYKPEDILIFIELCKRGKYGQWYEGFDIVKFMDKLNQYDDERMNAFQLYDNSKYKVSEKVQLTEKGKEAIEAMKKATSTEKVLTKLDLYDIEMRTKVNNAWKEFNKIGEGQDSEWGLRSKRFISHNGKMISFDEYLKTI